MANLHLFGARHRSCASLTTQFHHSSFDNIFLYSRVKSHLYYHPLQLAFNFQDNDIFISFAPILFSSSFVSDLLTNSSEKNGSFIFLSSTSVFSKIQANSLDSSSYTHFADGESIISSLIVSLPSSKFLVIRLSMLWGNYADQNIHKLYSFSSTFGFLPVSTFSYGLRAPIHHLQLAEVLSKVSICVNDIPSSFYTLIGPDILSYQQICILIVRYSSFTLFRPFLLYIPYFVVLFLHRFVQMLRLSFLYSIVSMFSRQSHDLIYEDNSILEHVPEFSFSQHFNELFFHTYCK